MIGRLYTAAIGSQTQTGTLTLVEVASAADSVTMIERAWIKQTSYDASENLGVKIEDVSIAGTGGTAVTPRPLQEGDAAFGGTVTTARTGEPTYSGTVYLEDGFNVLSGFLWTPASDDEVIVISPSQIMGMFLDVAPTTGMDFSYGVTLREIGG